MPKRQKDAFPIIANIALDGDNRVTVNFNNSSMTVDASLRRGGEYVAIFDGPKVREGQKLTVGVSYSAPHKSVKFLVDGTVIEKSLQISDFFVPAYFQLGGFGNVGSLNGSISRVWYSKTFVSDSTMNYAPAAAKSDGMTLSLA